MIARAKVFAFACIDPRFLRALETFIEKKFGLKPTEHDIKTDAGGIKQLAGSGPISDWLVLNAQIAYNNHGTRTFVLCNHMGCSYYKETEHPKDAEQEMQFHKRDLEAAAAILKSRLPDIRVFKYVVRLEEKPSQKFVFHSVQ